MTEAIPIPARLDDMTPEWLTRALAPAHPHVDVSDVRVLERTSGTNGNARLALEYRKRSSAPETLFVKLPSTGETQRELVRQSGMAAREVGFYRELAPFVSLPIARCHHAAYDPATGDFVILLEDAEAASFRFLAPTDSISIESARGAIEDLADLHLATRTGGPLEARSRWVGPQIRLRAYGAGMLETALKHCRGSLDDEFARVARFYVDHHDDVHDAWEAGAWSIIHGDCHWGNLFLMGDRIGFFDWGCVARMPGMREVAYFLCLGLRVEERRAYERELIRLYVDRVAAGGGPRMSEDEAWFLHRLHGAYAVPASAPASIYELLKGKVEFAEEVAREFLRRAAAAVTDLESIEALEERRASRP